MSVRSLISTKMEKAEKAILEFRAFRSYFKRKLKQEREPKTADVIVRYILPSDERVFVSTPVALHEPSVFANALKSDDESPKRKVRILPEAEDDDDDGDDDGEFLQDKRPIAEPKRKVTKVETPPTPQTPPPPTMDPSSQIQCVGGPSEIEGIPDDSSGEESEGAGNFKRIKRSSSNNNNSNNENKNNNSNNSNSNSNNSNNNNNIMTTTTTT